MKPAQLYIKSHESQDFFEGLKAACQYLDQDGRGMKGLREIIDGIEEASEHNKQDETR